MAAVVAALKSFLLENRALYLSDSSVAVSAAEVDLARDKIDAGRVGTGPRKEERSLQSPTTSPFFLFKAPTLTSRRATA